MLGRVSFSPNIRDRLDYSCALFDAAGRLLGQATHIPVHLGSMAFAMQGLVDALDWAPGQTVMLNDPYRGGTHLPDVTFIAPVFAGAGRIGFVANRAHHADIGADTPGSMPLSTTLAEEGVVIPPTVVRRDGAWVREAMEPILDRLRDRAASEGDFSAQVAANRVGRQRLETLVQSLGRDCFERLSLDLQAYGRRLARASLRDLPDGRYRFTDLLDDAGQGATDIPIRVCLEVDDGRVRVDFSGTADQVGGNLNCPLPVTAAAVFYVFRCLMPEQVPACHGALADISIEAPEGSLVNARAPAAVTAGNVETSTRIVDVVCGALAQAAPDRVPAASQGTMNNLAIGARGADGWDYYETLAGGNGASADADGRSARHSHMTNTLNTPVEVLERHYPMRIDRYAVRPGSGGKGRFRGGDGVERAYRFLADGELTILSERRRRGPWGLNGGGDGRPGMNRLDEESLGAKVHCAFRAGQVLLIATPGGGGNGAEATSRSGSSSD